MLTIVNVNVNDSPNVILVGLPEFEYKHVLCEDTSQTMYKIFSKHISGGHAMRETYFRCYTKFTWW